MEIKLYTTTSEKTRLVKNLTNEQVLSGELKAETDIRNPVFIFESVNPVGYNYVYIPSFSRYYFVNDISSVRTGLWRMSCTVDVLMSFAEYIQNLQVIVNRSENTDNSRYLADNNVWKTTVRNFTDTITFPSGLSEDGEFILITAGG